MQRDFNLLKRGFIDPRAINPALRNLFDHFEEINEEFLKNKDQLSWVNWGYDAGYYGEHTLESRPWKVAPLFGSDAVHENCNILPKLFEVLYNCGIRKRVGISVLEAGQEIPAHIDPDPEIPGQSIIIRGLWGLDIKEEQNKKAFISLFDPEEGIAVSKQLKNNQLYLFWGRNMHRVKNNLSTPRYMVCFDTEVFNK
jgi:hypothetical protein